MYQVGHYTQLHSLSCVICVDDAQVMTGSARRTVPCTVISHHNANETSAVPVTIRANIEPDAASGETKSVVDLFGISCCFIYRCQSLLWQSRVLLLVASICVCMCLSAQYLKKTCCSEIGVSW